MQPEIINNLNPSSAETVLSGWSKLAIPIVVLLVTYIFTYRYNVEVRAGDLVLKLEEAFIKLGRKLAFLEYRSCYDGYVQNIFKRCVKNPDELEEHERSTLEDLDQCIRFLYVCALLAGDKIDSAGKMGFKGWFFPSRLIPQAYYFYLNQLNDQKNRSDLGLYVGTFFPVLREWLDRNSAALTSYTKYRNAKESTSA
jgi:hypothetical protein